jgi:uncharacterized membrane protein
MSPTIWAKMHGAAVHFPIALVLCSWALDSTALLVPGFAARRGLHAAGYWTLLLGALGTVPAVVSGLVMAKGVMLGHDTLRLHHLFAWPAFSLIVGIATWRFLKPEFGTRKELAVYLAAMGCAAVLVGTAGYMGGEMLLAR